MLCSCLLFSPVNKPPSSKEEKDKTSMNAVAYISSGVALLLLLIVSIMVGIWCYSKSHRKKIERFVSLKVITLFCQVFRDPEDGEQSCPPPPPYPALAHNFKSIFNSVPSNSYLQNRINVTDRTGASYFSLNWARSILPWNIQTQKTRGM